MQQWIGWRSSEQGFCNPSKTCRPALPKCLNHSHRCCLHALESLTRIAACRMPPMKSRALAGKQAAVQHSCSLAKAVHAADYATGMLSQ